MAERPKHNLWTWFQDFSAVVLQPALGFLTLLSGTLLTFDFAAISAANPKWSGPLGILGGFSHLWLFIGLAVASLVLSLVNARRDGTLKEMRQTLSAHKSQVDEISNVIIILFDGLLLNLANKLDIKQGAQVRLSLYIHDSDQRAFIPCGRYSTNPIFRAPGRTSYPENQGCIGQGWANGWHFDDKVPPANQAAARRVYNQKNYSVPDQVTDGIRMKSTQYASMRLNDALGASVAVLVVEAMMPDHFAEAHLRATIESTAVDYARVIHEMRGYLPTPAKAAESGL